MPEFGVLDFTQAQLDAIRYRAQDACVVAGPGSGKTTVLVERFRALIEEEHFDPHSILAITFTEKAAANMKAKLAEKFSHSVVLLRELESAWVSTIHGFCARVLRENAILAGIDPRFGVLDARESDDMQYACLNAALDELVAEHREDALALIESLQNPSLVGDLKSAYDGIRSAGKTIDEVRAMPNPLSPASPTDLARRIRAAIQDCPIRVTPVQRTQRAELLEWTKVLAATDPSRMSDVLALLKNPINFGRLPKEYKPELEPLREELKTLVIAATDAHAAPHREILFSVLTRFDALYRERKAHARTLDFNDLESHTIDLLRRHTAVRDRIRTKFRQIMLDEFQDINRQQAELIGLIRGEDVFFAVGDVNQSIYGFRHAEPAIFHQYRDEIEQSGKHYGELLHNFRSRAEILQCVEQLLNAAEGIEPRQLVAGAQFSEKPGPSIEVLRAADPDKDEACQREARWIAHRIVTLRQESASDFRDFAVLCRNGESMKPILLELDRARVPYVCGRRQSFLLSREGLDITALLGTIANPRDGVALATVLRSTLVGLSDEALLRLRLNGSSLDAGLNAPLTGFAPNEALRIERFSRNLKRWRASLQIVPLDVLISRALGDCGFDWPPGSLIGDNVEAFLHLARASGRDRTLPEFLRELESIEKAANSESDLSDADQGNCVQVMTAHAAKGLEFPVTIVAAMDKGTQRGSASVTFTAEHGLGVKWKHPSSDDGLKDSWAFANKEVVKKREEEESNRLLYVAMTRAADHLILSYSSSRQKPQGWAKLVDEHFGNRVALHTTDPPPLSADSNRQVNASKVLILPRPVVTDQQDSAVNVTSLSLFATCPRKYYLQRYIGWGAAGPLTFDSADAAAMPDDFSGAELGSFVHELLSGKQGEYPREAQDLARVFQQSELARRAAAAVRSEREWDFIVQIDGTLIRGSIDLWFEEDGKIFLVDYKTDTPPVHPAGYSLQLAVYGLALERALEVRPARGYLHFLRPDLITEVPFDDACLNNAREVIGRLKEAQNKLEFELQEGDHCARCPYFRSLCPAGLEKIA